MIENFILGLADEAIKNPDASIHDLIGRLGYVHKTKLPKPEQEPVAWIKKNEQGRDIAIAQVALDSLAPEFKWIADNWKDADPLYRAPPQRKPLTDMAIERAYDELLSQPMREQDKRVIVNFARAIEKAHGIGGEA